ncbi:hypothetical protein GCM10010282_67960 [Streptomyces roseolus]|nr:hypothetical protein GCM10010282_67960 [Streptomyces roseolus]
MRGGGAGYDGAVATGAERGATGRGRTPALCLVRGVYTTRVQRLFPLDPADIPDKASSGRIRRVARRNRSEDRISALTFPGKPDARIPKALSDRAGRQYDSGICP